MKEGEFLKKKLASVIRVGKSNVDEFTVGKDRDYMQEDSNAESELYPHLALVDIPIQMAVEQGSRINATVDVSSTLEQALRMPTTVKRTSQQFRDFVIAASKDAKMLE